MIWCNKKEPTQSRTISRDLMQQESSWVKGSTWNRIQSLDQVRMRVRTSIELYLRDDSSGLSTSKKKHHDKLVFISILQIMESSSI